MPYRLWASIIYFAARVQCTMSAAYANRCEAMFLCMHPKGPQMSFSAAMRFMKKSKDFVRKWINRYKQIKNVDDLPERGSNARYYKKQDKIIIRFFEKHPIYNLRQA
jgi:hypothetical protein